MLRVTHLVCVACSDNFSPRSHYCHKKKNVFGSSTFEGKGDKKRMYLWIELQFRKDVALQVIAVLEVHYYKLWKIPSTKKI